MIHRLATLWKRVPAVVRKPFVGFAGTIVILAGIAMLVLPGPGWVTIFAGLVILQTEFAWAARLHKWLIDHFKSAFEALKAKRNK